MNLYKILDNLDKKRIKVTKEMEKAMMNMYPTGKNVYFKFRCNQINHSSGNVLCYYPPYIRIRFHSKKEMVRDIHYSNLLG
jgi:hypothetical protein